jgi:Ca2+-binding RTX toxin-like protein
MWKNANGHPAERGTEMTARRAWRTLALLAVATTAVVGQSGEAGAGGDQFPQVFITVPVDQAIYARGVEVLADYSCTDDVALQSCEGTVDDGSPLDTDSPGTHEFTVTAVDSGDRHTVVTRTYTVVDEEECVGEPVTVNLAFDDEPTSGDDVIVGTDEGETIRGLGGDDLICGRGGGDTIGGGGDRDRVFGASGNDTLAAGPGGGLVSGGAGNDGLIGGRGVDTLRGGPDNDDLDGGPAADLHDGGPGHDVCHLGVGRDTVRSCEVISIP